VRRLLLGEIVWDSTKPDGSPRKLLDISRMKAMGWSPRIALDAGLRAPTRTFFHAFSLEKRDVTTRGLVKRDGILTPTAVQATWSSLE
jgi:hypothetical protein